MADKTPLRLVLDNSNNPTGIAEFQSGETIGNSFLTNSSFTLVDDSSTTSTLSLGESLLLAGGTGITSVVSGDSLTFSLDNTAVTPATYGSSTAIPVLIIDQQGRITGASTQNISTTLTIADDTSTLTNINLGSDTLKISGDTGITTSILGDTVNIDLDDTAVTPATYGSSTAIPVIAIDQQGRITSASTQNISTTLTISDDTSTLANINLGSDTLKISGTTNEIETSISNDTITIGLPNNVTISNNLIVTGDLTVNGTTTTINSTTLSVDDKNIELASVATPTDVTADGAGITIKGATDKTFNWLDATDSFTSSEHIDLVSGKVFKINNSTVLSSTEVLGKSVPSGTILGTSDSQTLTNKTISGSNNTITNISNSSLTNSFITLSDDTSSTTTISLGETLKITGTTNEIETLISGDTIIVGLPNNVTVAGSLDVNGASTLKGSITLGQNSGDSTEDSITVNARFVSNLEPLHNITYDLGSPNRRWRDLYLSGNTIDLNGATISGDGSGNITISATGAVLPVGSQVGTQSIATADPDTGISTRSVPLYTQASGLVTQATSFIFKSGNETGQVVFTDFTVSNGQNIINYNAGGTLFAF